MKKNSYRQMPSELMAKALKMLETENIDTVTAALHIRKAALKRLIREGGIMDESSEVQDNSVAADSDVNVVPVSTTVSPDSDATTAPDSDATTVSPDSDVYAATAGGKHAETNLRSRRYTPEFKVAALAMMEEKGAVATIRELGISSYTLYDWKKKASGNQYPAKQGSLTGKERKRYTQEFKEIVIAAYREKGRQETLSEYGIANNTLYNWLHEAGIKKIGI